MSKLKISPNLFLEEQELNRLVRFMSDDGYKKMFNALIKSYGIIKNDTLNSFLTKETYIDEISISAGVAIDRNLNMITSNSVANFTLPNTSSLYWAKIKYDTSNEEVGTVNVTSDGSITGIDTSFRDVLRGHFNYPTKIKFSSNVNTEEYEVVRIISDNQAVISGVLSPENGVKYSVVGCFTPGFTPTEENKRIYEYDSCSIELIESATEPILTEGEEFLVSKIYFDDEGHIVIEDLRSRYLFNTVNADDNSQREDQLSSLISWGHLGGNQDSAFWKLSFNHSYKIYTFDPNLLATDGVLRITSGYSNFTGSDAPPENIFSGWLLVNRTNMSSTIVNGNQGGMLSLDDFDSSLTSDGHDLVIKPNFEEIEYRVTINAESEEAVHYSFIGRLDESVLNYVLPKDTINQDSPVLFQYRLLNGSSSTPFRYLNVAPFINADGGTMIMPNPSVITLTL